MGGPILEREFERVVRDIDKRLTKIDRKIDEMGPAVAGYKAIKKLFMAWLISFSAAAGLGSWAYISKIDTQKPEQSKPQTKPKAEKVAKNDSD